MHREQAAMHHRRLEQLWDQSGHQTKVLQRVAWAGSSPAPATVTSFHSMGEGDDPQTFDKVFQATAEACFWLKEEWVMRLLQVLSCKTPAAVLSLTAAARNSFKDVCQVVVNHWDSHLGIIRTNLSPMPSFMSRTLKEPYELLDIKPVWTSTYHPQTEGLVEWLNKT